MTDPFSANRKYGDRPPSNLFLRVMSFLAGLAAIPLATVLPLLFISNELLEAKSARQWGGNPMMGIVAVVIGIVFALGAGFGSFLLIRFALRGSTQPGKPPVV